jgi:hypothetical protein
MLGDLPARSLPHYELGGAGGRAHDVDVALPEPKRKTPNPQATRVPVALPPGAAVLLGHRSGERAGGLAWAARFPHEHAAIVALLRRALSVDEGPAA